MTTAPAGPALRMQLLGEFTLFHRDTPIALGEAGQRLLAYLALRHGPARRAQVAGALWLHGTGARASSNLRAALCRLPRPDGTTLVHSDAAHVHLAEDVEVDLTTAQDRIRRVQGGEPPVAAEGDRMLTADLLPLWDDDWVVVERERHRQLRLHALEQLALSFREAGRFAEALSAGLAAVAGEPLRESSHRRVIEIHLAEGNAAEALRQYELYRRLVRDELGLAPSGAIRTLVRHLLGRPADVD